MTQIRAAAIDLGRRPPPRAGERGVMLALGLAVLVAWIVLVAMLVGSAMHHGSAAARTSPRGGGAAGMAGMQAMSGMAGMSGMSMPGMSGMPGMGPAGHRQTDGHRSMLLESSAGGAIAMWALMVVAMMIPAGLPAIRHVAGNSLRWRRRRAMATFVAVYVSIWIAFGAVLVAVGSLWSSIGGAAACAAALALAACWQLTVHKRRALTDCHRPLPLPPRGWRATAGVVRFASFNGLACVRSCWAMMLAMGLASSITIFWMVTITGIVTTEKLAQRPRRATRAAAVILAAGAVLVAGAAIVGSVRTSASPSRSIRACKYVLGATNTGTPPTSPTGARWTCPATTRRT